MIRDGIIQIQKFFFFNVVYVKHDNISPVGLLLPQTMVGSTKSQISIQKYIAKISQMSMHKLYKLSY